MPHPIYGPPSHRLERLEVRIDLPDQHNSHVTSALIQGISGGKRSALFAVAAHWDPDEIERGLQASDWVSHAVLAFLQDRPSSQEQAQDALVGETSSQDPLPW